MKKSNGFVGRWLVGAALWLCWGAYMESGAAPVQLCGVEVSERQVEVLVHVPSGYGHIVLEGTGDLGKADWRALVAAGLNGEGGRARFVVPQLEKSQILRVKLGEESVSPAALFEGEETFALAAGSQSLVCDLGDREKAGHVLNRLAYGPRHGEVERVLGMGVAAFIQEQLHAEEIDESENLLLQSREELLFELYQPRVDQVIIGSGAVWRFRRGTSEPPLSWLTVGYPDEQWELGPSGFGYGDGDDRTELTEMRQVTEENLQEGYLSVYIRKAFVVEDLSAIRDLILSIDYDDGFVAYLNGTEVARGNMSGSRPTHTERAMDTHEAGTPEEFDLSDFKHLLREGGNVLAIQGHNYKVTSSDFSLIPELFNRRILDEPARGRIAGIEALQDLVHVRGVYSERQLQSVLAEFWENHFTTDYDKVAEYLEDLENSDGQPAMPARQAKKEAAQIEYEEYQFFYDHALGNFGDLLLFSATSPSQLIYLDNVLNRREEPNENYAREILELFAFGVDNRYTQRDIEELARCFTGWTVRKAGLEQRKPFPESAREPLTEGSVQVQDVPVVAVGDGWKYFKGEREPSPAEDGSPTTEWTEVSFDDSAWTPGATSIGYGDGDDATLLTDMRYRYLSVYLRRAFTVSDPAQLENLVWKVAYDDGYVAYLNGEEISRSRTMRDVGGVVPGFDDAAARGHEVDDEADLVSLRTFTHLLRPSPQVNVLAVQVHNHGLSSSDLSIHPELVDRRPLPGSMENGNPNGVWTFRFDPEQHDTGSKRLFAGSEHEIVVPAGRTGPEGVMDAVEVIDHMVGHRSTAEFICLKLINKFVSDEISLASYQDRSADPGLLAVMDEAIAAWHSTKPAGNIRTVLGVIFDGEKQANVFWSRQAHQAKIKTPVEYINSSVRAMEAQIMSRSLSRYNEAIGMVLFQRNDPDGWSELGTDWMNTGSLLERIKFSQDLTANRTDATFWNVRGFLLRHGLETADEIIGFFDELLFQGGLLPEHKAILKAFVETDEEGVSKPLDSGHPDYARRVEELVAMILSMPQWQYQ